MDDMLKVMIREMEAKNHIKEKGYDMCEQHDAHVVSYESYLDSLLPEDPFTGFNYEGDDDFALEEDF
ncbi:MAG: hypothetical protein ACWGQW_04180 [bacterium]